MPDSMSTAVTLNNSSSAAEEGKCKKLPDHIIGKILLPDHIIGEIHETFLTLQRDRVLHRQIPTSLVDVDALRNYTLCDSHKLHKTIMPGIISLDIVNSKDIIATGGADTNATVFDNLSGKIVSTLQGHSKQVTDVKFINEGELLITGSADTTVCVWQRSEDGSYKYKHTLTSHTAEVQAVSVHPNNKYFITASLDCTWQLYDITRDLHSARVANVAGVEGFTCAAFHPDGHIIGTSTSHYVRFWDVLKQDAVIKLSGHAGLVTSIAFSENGYFLATAAHDGVKLWDLRFLRNFMTFLSDDNNKYTRTVEFDHSGSYLAAGGACLSVYNIRTAPKCEQIITFPDKSGIANISSLKFGEDAKNIAAGTVDSKLLSVSLPKDI